MTLASALPPEWEWEALGRAGFLVSICCGPSGNMPFRWTVLVMARDRRSEFDRPYAAESFAHAVAIAQAEITRRGWDVNAGSE